MKLKIVNNEYIIISEFLVNKYTGEILSYSDERLLCAVRRFFVVFETDLGNKENNEYCSRISCFPLTYREGYVTL